MRKLLLATALAIVSCTPALAAPACGTSADIRDQLSERFKEAPMWRGVSIDGKQLLEVYGAPDGSTWTLVTTDATGQSCLVAAGKYWLEVEPTPDGPLT